MTLLMQIGEALLDVPVMLVARRRRQPTSFALYLKEIFNQRIIWTWRWIWVVGQAAKPF